MKIKKEKKIILEAVDLNEADEETVQQKLDEVPETDTVDLDGASVKEIAADIQQGAEEVGKDVPAKAAVEEAKSVFDWADFIQNPYGTAKIGKIKKVLQRSLDAVKRKETLNKLSTDAGGKPMIKGDYPNVLIYGSAGFAKTAIVEEFCEEHGINLFQLDAKTLDLATVGGIPYPMKNDKGEWTQIPVASDIWKSLELPNTVIFLDELNRANGRIRGTLLSLVNNHILPIATEDPKTGTVKTMKYFPNILFTVSAINPAGELFKDVNELDIAEISRNAAVVKQEADRTEFFGHIKKLYDAIKKLGELDPNNPELQNLVKIYNGQYDLAEKILLDKGFSFDNDDDNKANQRKARQQGEVFNSLNYRSFFLNLIQCDGTKADFLDAISTSGFSQTKQLMFKDILANYTDKATTGNTIWGKPTAAQSARAAKAAVNISKSLDDFTAALPDD